MILTSILTSRGRVYDLDVQHAIIDEMLAADAVSAAIVLEEGENKKVAKQKMSRAAKMRGYALAWRASTVENKLRFTLYKQGERPFDSWRANSDVPVTRSLRGPDYVAPATEAPDCPR